jgi:hypothetical protein
MADLATQLRDYLDATAPEVLLSEVHSLRAVRLLGEEAPVHRHRWPIAAVLGVAAAAAIVLAVLFWPRSGDPAPFINQGSTIPDTTVPAPTTPAATGTTMAASEVRWDAPLPIYYPTPTSGELVALSAHDAWVLSADGRVFHLHDGATFRLPQPEPGRELAVAPDGTVWMSTGVGVFSFEGEAWTQRFVGETWALTVDGDGSVWLGGIYWDPISAWLARWDGRAFVRIGWDPAAYRQGGYTVMAATPDGSIWMAEIGWLWSNLYRYAGGAMEAVQIGDYHPNPSSLMGPVMVFDLEVAPNGDLWVGGFGSGDYEGQVVLARYDGAEWTVYDWPFADRSPAGEVLFFDLAVGPDGTLWLSFPGGLGSYDGTTWSLRAATMAEGGIAIVDVAPDGTVWYTDQAGLHTFP